MRHFTLGILFLLISTLYSKAVEVKKPLEVSYTSVGSSMTKIKLSLYKNGKFALIINIFGDDVRATRSKGRWYKEDGYYVLTFKKRKTLSLQVLFPDNSAKYVEVLNEETFRFKVNAIQLLIYGVTCKRGVVKA